MPLCLRIFFALLQLTIKSSSPMSFRQQPENPTHCETRPNKRFVKILFLEESRLGTGERGELFERATEVLERTSGPVSCPQIISIGKAQQILTENFQSTRTESESTCNILKARAASCVTADPAFLHHQCTQYDFDGLYI